MTKKDKIIQIAKKHFAKKSYDNTTLDDIAKEVGVTKPALYHHFKNKNEIYNEIFIKSFSKLNITNVKNIKEYINVLADFFEKDENITYLFSKELSCGANNLTENSIKVLSKTILKLQELLKNTGINPFLLQTIIMTTLVNYKNTIRIRQKVAKVTNIDPNIKGIKDELYWMINKYIEEYK